MGRRLSLFRNDTNKRMHGPFFLPLPIWPVAATGAASTSVLHWGSGRLCQIAK
jgi:hypothetical protein